RGKRIGRVDHERRLFGGAPRSTSCQTLRGTAGQSHERTSPRRGGRGSIRSPTMRPVASFIAALLVFSIFSATAEAAPALPAFDTAMRGIIVQGYAGGSTAVTR